MVDNPNTNMNKKPNNQFIKKHQPGHGFNKTIDENYEEEEFSDDFEEYFSDNEEEVKDNRITDKANEMEMSEVMNIYEDFVNEPAKNNKLATIRENSYEESTDGSTRDQRESTSSRFSGQSPSDNNNHNVVSNQIRIKKDKLKDMCIDKMGSQNFYYVYNYIKEKRAVNESENNIAMH